ncbi:hypothetical protein NIES4102_41720 (plasmid) [Chondrocystis sp. NIES-4102]|nr:hypothetical protein NIES4102_41720 [Chondrocystis sp. NIES-4102]
MLMINLPSILTVEQKKLKLGSIALTNIQSLVITATFLIYYYYQNSQIQDILQLITNMLFIVGGIILSFLFFQKKLPNLKKWHLLVIFSVFAAVFSYETTSHAQILEQIDNAIGDVGTAAGSSFSTTVLEAIIDLIRIAIFIVVGAAVIAAIAFGVTQGQWQAPLLVVGTVAGIGLFLEIMGEVVFG